jgi:hypothetical protein
MTQRTCAAMSRRGEPCRSAIVGPGGYCRLHDPERAAAVRADRVRGGRTASKLRVLRGRRQRLDTMQALVRFLSDLMQDTLAQRVDPRVSNAVVYAVSVQLQAIEKGDLERRVVDLETRSRWRKA